MPRPQLELFASPSAQRLAARFASLAPLAARLPAGLRFGTSSWYFPGWEGLVWPGPRTEKMLAHDGLGEYARHPLLRTVGFDRSYYRPLGERDLLRYASQLPQDFPCCSKVCVAYTSAVVPGSLEPNPRFLSAPDVAREVLGPLRAHFAQHTGPLLFELPPVPASLTPSPRAFCASLEALFTALPADLRYAVELRDRALFTPRYAAVLRAHGVAHVYNHWRAMPSLEEQARALPPQSNPFVVQRLLLPHGSRYEQRRDELAPFDRVREPDPEMRAQSVALARAGIDAGREVFLLVGNKAEGCAVLTVEALAALFVGAPSP